MEWISVEVRVPNNRRNVIAWGRVYGAGFTLTPPQGKCLGILKCNGGEWPTGNCMFKIKVTHWADIVGPEFVKPSPPPKSP